MSQPRSNSFQTQWHNLLDQVKSNSTTRGLDDVQVDLFLKKIPFQPTALGAEERAAVVEDVGRWAQLDDAGVDKQGVGLFFEKHISGQVCVVSIVPGCAADKTGVIKIRDQLISVNQKDVSPWTLAFIRQTIQGKPGTFVILDFKRHGTVDKPGFSYRVNIMRGSPQFVENSSRFGQTSAEKLNLLWDKLKESERQYFRVHEKNLIEKARCDEALERKAACEQNEEKLEEELSKLKRELAHEERKLQIVELKIKNLKEGLDDGPDSEGLAYFVV